MPLPGSVSMPVSFKALRHDDSKAQMLNDSSFGQRLRLGPKSRGSCFVWGLRFDRESLAAPGAFAGTAAVRCDVPSLGQSS